MVGLEYIERHLEERKLELLKEIGASKIERRGDYILCEFKTPGFDEAKKKYEEKRLWNRFLKLINRKSKGGA